MTNERFCFVYLAVENEGFSFRAPWRSILHGHFKWASREWQWSWCLLLAAEVGTSLNYARFWQWLTSFMTLLHLSKIFTSKAAIANYTYARRQHIHSKFHPWRVEHVEQVTYCYGSHYSHVSLITSHVTRHYPRQKIKRPKNPTSSNKTKPTDVGLSDSMVIG